MPSSLGIVASAYSATFDPLSLSPVIWLDASDTSTITASSGAVSAWADKSGNANDFTQSTSSAQPTTGSATQNGRNLLRFDGNDSLERASDVTTTAYTLFVIYSNTNVGTAVVGNSLMSAIGTSPSWFLQKGGTGVLQELTVGFNSGLLFDTSTKRLVASRKTASTGATMLRVDRNNYTPTSQGSGTLNLALLGKRYDGNWLKCDICEVLVYGSALSDANVVKVENYLSAKWATP